MSSSIICSHKDNLAAQIGEHLGNTTGKIKLHQKEKTQTQIINGFES